ncbi:MAG: amino acid adenylation domain-containing protein [Burkholderiales bacterium]|nr:amino acid adenylation domain-containing protein [Burkholderiales bacterium]
MKVLNILLKVDNFNSLTKSFIDYLIDSGNFVTILSENHSEFLNQYSYNIKKANNFTEEQFDFFINFTSQNCDVVHNQITLNIHMNNECLSIYILNMKNEVIVCKQILLSEIIVDKNLELQYLIAEITEAFIDGVIELQRCVDIQINRETLELSSENLFYDLIIYIDKFEEITKFYNVIDFDEQLIKIDSFTNNNQLNDSTISISLIKNLSDEDLQVVLLSLLSLLNGRLQGVYSYTYQQKHKSIDKFIRINENSSIADIKKDISNQIYGIFESSFTYNISSNQRQYFVLSHDECEFSDHQISFTIGDNVIKVNNINVANGMAGYLEEILYNYDSLSDDGLYYDLIKNIGAKETLSKVPCISNYRYKKENTLIKVFEEQVLKTPDNIALVFKDIKYSYKDLNDVCNKVGAYIIKNVGVKPNDLIALYVVRNEYMLISILSILKAGAVYVPIDPSYPEDRISHILSDTAAKLILTNECLIDKLYLFKDSIVINTIEKLLVLLPYEQPLDNPLHVANADDLAYIIYTSGTTGKPKGTMLEHSGVINMINSQSHAFKLNTEVYKHCLWYSSYVFDAHVSELFTAILNGHTIHLIDDEIRHDFERLTSYIHLNKINIATIPPALLSKDNLLSLETIVVAGDKTDRDIIDAYYCSKTNIINAYGPTETSVCATLHLYKSDGYNNIGSALKNITTYVLDPKFNPVPMNIVGELYIGGAGVARGYLNQPELTNERFIHNPFQTTEESKSGVNSIIYKTGDLVIMNDDGNLEYIGRNDFQIKINGYRIEIGEIENTIQQFPDIKQAAVIAQSINDKNKALIAYYISSNNINENALESFLKNKLPQYMVPRVFVRLHSFPVSISGKIDRKSIPKVDLSRSRDYVAPSNDLQVNLCKIWSEVLGINYNEISIKDDFFKLGGNSIAAIKIAQKLMRIDYYIAIKDIFSYKTIEQVSQNLTEIHDESPGKNHFIEEFNSLLDDDIEWVNYANNVQKGLVTYSMQYPDSDAYMVQIRFDYNSPINVENLKISWKIAIEKFSSLRMSFDFVNSQVIQLVHRSVEINWSYHDLSSYVPSQQKEFVNKLMQSDRKSLYVLHFTPLFRLYLVKNSNSHYTFIFSNHHAIIDGWGINVLFDFIHNTYNSLQNNEFMDDYTHDNDLYYELSSKYCSSNSNRDLEYWNNLLVDVEPSNEINVLSLKTISNGQRFENNSEYILEITHQIRGVIQLISEKESVTLNSIFQFVWHKLLNIFTQCPKSIVGTVVTGRDISSVNVDAAVGIFINTLPIIVSWDNHHSILEQINLINNLIVEANNNSLAFLGDIQKENRLFNNLFVFQDVRELLRTEHVHINNIQDVQKLDFPITIEIIQSTDNLKLKVRYDDKVFSAERVEYLAKYARYILYTALENLNSSHQTLDNIPQYELEQLYELQSNIEDTDNQTIIDLFEHKVAKFPDNIALVCDKTLLTYTELNALSNQFANYLKSYNSIQAKDFVALYLERNEYIIIAILAVLKLGAVYVPIDIDYPSDRVEYLLNDTKAKLLITNQHNSKINMLGNLVKDICEIEPVVISQTLSGLSTKNINTEILSHDLIYIIYTSGTTGSPKGVMVNHGGVVNTITDLYDVYDFKLGNKVLAFTSYVFDVSVSEFFVTLTNGGELHIINNDIRTNPSEISNYIIKNSINYAYLPPVILSNLPKLNYKSLRAIIYAGEPCDITTGKYWSNTKVKLYNYYGPTETSIYSIGKEVFNGDVHLIGQPMKNVKVYILNDKLNIVPYGVIGELYIGGNGVADGYLNLPEMTKEKFIKNIYQTEREQSLNVNGFIYKTGDLVRYNGSYIEYIGRNDSQVKIRGFRIELGEIDNVLNGYPGITTCASIVQTINNSKVIISFYVSSNKFNDVNNIIHYLEQRLPHYMVPSAVIYLESLPVTINGKLDKKTLLKYISSNLSEEIQAPETTTEIQLRDIWSNVLNIQSAAIGTNSNFFRLGGNSISIVNLVVQINKKMSYKVDFSMIHKHSTIKSLAEFMTTSSHDALVNLFNVSHDYSKPMLVLFHTARGSSEVYFKFASMLTQHYDIYLVDSYNLSKFHEKEYITSLDELTEKYYSELKQRVINYDKVLVAGWSFGGIIANEIVVKISKYCNKHCSLLMFDTYTPKSLEEILNGVNLSVHMEDIYASTIQKEVGNVHDVMYKKFQPSVNISDASCYLIKATDADIFIKDKIAKAIITKERFNGWEKYFTNIVSYPINATHETLFDNMNMDKMISYIIDISKKVKNQ